ncbi:acidic fibroblast growth factor intracellular-binding protein-like isoform X2 [Pomacea canaliculata]|uniref:acidic fibroblast growth factor intracellular-binding protein-like isoform X2 n=1 Tax=Pomacea canaliculata TaxID=400727 RepID=UPI000D728FDC|nr:acidic fibroblast growth factor intracellular-binding protein-like isoform X2 [Pomacea canaliculata]
MGEHSLEAELPVDCCKNGFVRAREDRSEYTVLAFTSGKKMNEVEVFVGNHTTIDPEIYELWLKGYSANEAAGILQKQESLQPFQATLEDLLSDVQDHFHLFNGLENMLKSPPRLQNQQVYQIDEATQAMLIEKYYSFDASVIREVLGRKLTSRSRKDLDDISELTCIPLRSCRRQFDNVKRVFKTVEELKGYLVDNICTHFRMPEALARDYAAVVFIANNRFETGKKKLNYLHFRDFVACATHMITNWSYMCTNHEDMDVDLDRNFLQLLRELKVLIEKDCLEEHRALMLKAAQGLPERVYMHIDSNFRTLSKTIIGIANGLNHSRESRDIFIDLYEKLIEPCLQNQWSFSDLQMVLTAYKDTALQMDCFLRVSHLQTVWERYMGTLINCVLQMYPRS